MQILLSLLILFMSSVAPCGADLESENLLVFQGDSGLELNWVASYSSDQSQPSQPSYEHGHTHCQHGPSGGSHRCHSGHCAYPLASTPGLKETLVETSIFDFSVFQYFPDPSIRGLERPPKVA